MAQAVVSIFDLWLVDMITDLNKIIFKVCTNFKLFVYEYKTIETVRNLKCYIRGKVFFLQIKQKQSCHKNYFQNILFGAKQFLLCSIDIFHDCALMNCLLLST